MIFDFKMHHSAKNWFNPYKPYFIISTESEQHSPLFYPQTFFVIPAALPNRKIRAYVEKGLAQGHRPELVGGGLIRSAGGWSVIKAMRRVQDHMKSDERILGDGDFTQSVLDDDWLAF